MSKVPKWIKGKFVVMGYDLDENDDNDADTGYLHRNGKILVFDSIKEAEGYADEHNPYEYYCVPEAMELTDIINFSKDAIAFQREI